MKDYYSNQKEEVVCLNDDKNRSFVMELVLHCSDISNPFKPFAICAKWADLVVEEFCLQGDKERSEGFIEINLYYNINTLKVWRYLQCVTELPLTYVICKWDS